MGCHALLHGIFPTQGSNLVPGIAGEFFTTDPPGEPLCCFLGDLRTVDLIPFSLSLLFSLPSSLPSLSISLSLLLSECVGRGCGGWGAVPWKESKTSPSVLAGTQPSITCAGVKSQKAATV